MRSLLSSYYGAPGAEDGALPPSASSSALGSSGGGPGSDGARAANSIDALSGFDPDAYVDAVLRATPLDALQSRCADMRAEMTSLDSDMQTLVYENYPKFLSAADATKRARGAVEGIEAKMASLKTQIEKATGDSATIHAKLSRHRDQAESLSGVRSLIQKLGAVFDLPARCRACVDRGALALAVRYYAAAKPLLDRYGDEGAFREAKREADAVAAEVAAKIRDAMRSATRERSSSEENPVSNLRAGECVDLLESLGESRDDLRREFLDARRDALRRRLETGVARSNPSDGGDAPASARDDPRAFVEAVDRAFLVDFRAVAAEYFELFPTERDRAPMVKATKALFADYFRVVSGALDFSEPDAPEPTSSVSEPTSSISEPTSSVSEPTSSREPPSARSTVGSRVPPLPPAKGLMQALATMAADLADAHRLVPEAGLGDRAAEAVERAVRRRVDAAFARLDRNLDVALETAEAETGDDTDAGGGFMTGETTGSSGAADAGSKSSSGSGPGASAESQTSSSSPSPPGPGSVASSPLRAFVACADALLTGVRETLADVRAVLEERPLMVQSWRGELEGFVRARADDVLGRLAEERLPVAGDGVGKRARRSTPVALLARARLATFIKTDGAPEIRRALAEFFPGGGDDLGARGDLGGVSPFLSSRCDAACDAANASLLASYAAAKTSAIDRMIRSSGEAFEWLDAREPRAPRPLVGFVLAELAEAEAEMEGVLPEGDAFEEEEEDAGLEGLGAGDGDDAAAAGVSSSSSYPAAQPLSPGGAAGGGLAAGTISRDVANAFRERAREDEARANGARANGGARGEEDDRRAGGSDASDPRHVAPLTTRRSVLARIATHALRSFRESVALRATRRAGYHQALVDAEALRRAVAGRFAGAREARLASDAAKRAALARCLDPAPLAGAVVDRILANGTGEGGGKGGGREGRPGDRLRRFRNTRAPHHTPSH